MVLVFRTGHRLLGRWIDRLILPTTKPTDKTKKKNKKNETQKKTTTPTHAYTQVWTARLGKQFKVACIGETTATAAREQGWEEARIFYPKENPGIDGWAAAVQAALGAGGEGGQEE